MFEIPINEGKIRIYFMIMTIYYSKKFWEFL